MDTPSDLISIYDAAELVNRHVNTIRNWTRRSNGRLEKYREHDKPNNVTYVSKKQLFQIAGRIEKEFVETQHVAHGSLGSYSPPPASDALNQEHFKMLIDAKDQMIDILREQIDNQREDIGELKNRLSELRKDNRELQKQLLNQPRALLNPYTESVDDVPMPTFPSWDS